MRANLYDASFLNETRILFSIPFFSSNPSTGVNYMGTAGSTSLVSRSDLPPTSRVLPSMTVDTDIGANSSTSLANTPCPQTPEKSVLFLPLFIRSERRIYAYIYTLVPRRADADDLLQETSLVMWDKFEASNPPNDFLAWGRRIAYHKVLDFYKKSRRSQARLSQLFLERIAEVGEADLVPQQEERCEALAECVEKLTPKSRDLLNYRFVEGATTQSTAEQVGSSVDAVYKALAKLRQSLFACVQNKLARENRP